MAKNNTTKVKQPQTRVKAKQPTKVVERVTIIQKEKPQGARWLGASPWVVIAGAIVVLLLVLLPIFPAEKTVNKTETVMVPVTKEKQEQQKTDETIKTYTGYMVEVGGIAPSTSTVTTMGTGWNGTWRLGDRELITTQNGNQVTGYHPAEGGNSFTGTISGNQVTGWWAEAPSYQPPDNAGDEVLTLATDGQSMTSTWRYGSSGSWSTYTWIRVGTVTSTGTGIGTSTGSITIDAVAEIVDVQRARGPGNTWILTLTAHDGTQTIYRDIVKDDLTKTGRATVSVTKTVSVPYTVQESREVTKQEIQKLRVSLLSLIMQNY